MTRSELRRLKGWFAALVRQHQLEDGDIRRNVRLKAHHTYQVCREARMVGGGIGLGDLDLSLVEAVALLHDVGRFEQYVRYQTFNDAESTDHAALGLSILEREGILESLEPEESTLVVRAITAHNRPELPPILSTRERLFAQILRDADKLDIWNIIVGYYEQRVEERNAAIAMGLSDTPGVSPSVLRRLQAHQSVFRKDLKNLNDLKLFHIGWVYDLNLPPSFRAVSDRRYLERIAQTLVLTAEIRDAIHDAAAYVSKNGAKSSPREEKFPGTG